MENAQLQSDQEQSKPWSLQSNIDMQPLNLNMHFLKLFIWYCYMISPLKVPRRKLNSNTNEILFEFEFTEPISFEGTNQF